MSKQLIKNRRFKEGASVNILHSPIYEDDAIILSDSSSSTKFQLTLIMENDLTPEMVQVGDIAAFGFAAGIVNQISSFQITVEFPNSTFPESGIERYVGNEAYHVQFFSMTDNNRITEKFFVAKYVEGTKQASYGFSKNIYGLEQVAELVLVPVRRLNDGVLSAIQLSKGYVLKSCDDDNYDNSTAWIPEFPLKLSGVSVDPIYRKAFLTKRGLESKGARARSKMTFELIG